MLRVSHIPTDYPFAGLLDMQQVSMSGLFEFGVRCATQESLRGSAAHALAGGGPFSHMQTDWPAPLASPAAAGETATAGRSGGGGCISRARRNFTSMSL
jgi:hypothetical protein